MRIKNISEVNFGHFKNRAFDTDADMVLIYGKNETGKSTMFGLLRSVLFGYKPERGNKNQFLPWGKKEASFEADVFIDNEDMHVFRIMKKTKSDASFRRNGKYTDEGNVPLPKIDEGIEGMYDKVYAIDTESANPTVEDINNMYSGQAVSKLKPLGQVYNKLDNDIKMCLSSAAKNSTSVKTHKNELRKIETKIAEINRKREEITQTKKEYEQEKSEIEEKRKKQKDFEIQLKKYREYNQYKDDIDIFNGINAAGKMPKKDLFDDVKGEVYEHITELEAGIQKNQAQINETEQNIKDNEAIINQYDDTNKRVYKSIEKINNLGNFGYSDEQLIKDRKQISQSKEEINDEAKEIFDNYEFEDISNIDKISLTEVNALMSDIKDIDSSILKLKNDEEKSKNNKFGKVSILFIVFAIVMLILAVIFPELRLLFSIFGGAGVVAAVLPIVFKKEEENTNIQDLQNERDKNVKLLKNAFGEFEIKESLLSILSDIVAFRINSLQNNYKKYVSLVHDYNYQKENFNEHNKAIDTLYFEIFNCEGNGDKLKILNNAKDEAGKLKIKADNATQNLLNNKTRLDKLKEEYLRLKNKKENIIDRLNAWDGVSSKEKSDNVENGRKTRASIQTKTGMLIEKYTSLIRFTEIIEKAEKDCRDLGVDFDDTLIEEEIKNLKNDIENMRFEIGRKKEKIESSLNTTELEILLSEQAVLEDKITERQKEGDQLKALVAILKDAQQEYRTNYQPQILKDAGEYLDMITDNRYNGFFIGDDEESNLYISGTNEIEINQTKLSSGTYDQVYFALRMAMAKKLDKDIALPMFFDDNMTFWDKDRTDKGIEIIKQIAAERQVFVFTCKENTYKNIEKNVKTSDVCLKTIEL